MDVTNETLVDWIKSGYAYVKHRNLSKEVAVVFCVDLFVYRHRKVAGVVSSYGYQDEVDVWTSCSDGQQSPWGNGRLNTLNIQIAKNVIQTLSMSDDQLAQYNQEEKRRKQRAKPTPNKQPSADKLNDDLLRAIASVGENTSGVVLLTRSVPLWSADVIPFLEKLADSPKPVHGNDIKVDIAYEIVIPSEFWTYLQYKLDWPLFERGEVLQLSRPMSDDQFGILFRKLKRSSDPLLVPSDRLWATIDEHLSAKRCTVVSRATETTSEHKTAISKCIASLKNTINWLTVNERTLIEDNDKYDAVYAFIKEGYVPFLEKLGIDPSDEATQSDDDDFHKL
jgi:hypothetical protein